MKKIKVKENLRWRIMETYKETRNIIRIGDKKSQEFWTVRGLKQRCPLSPMLFNIYVLDLEEEMEKEQIRGIVIGKEKFGIIMYADDIVLLARRKAELKEMMKRFRRFLKRKDLSLSPDKSKIMIFEKEWYSKGEEQRRENGNEKKKAFKKLRKLRK